MIKMEKRKMIALVIGIVLFAVFAFGLTYAYFYWSNDSENDTSVKLSVNKDIRNFINYNAGSAILTTEDSLFEPTDDYKNGLSTVVEFWMTPETPISIYGQLSLEITNMLSEDDTLDANISKCETIKWELTSKTSTDANAVETTVSSGTFYGKSIGDKIVLAEDFLLNKTATYYTFYIWLDQSAISGDYNLTGELLSAKISASASTETSHYGTSPLQVLTNLGLNNQLRNEKIDFSSSSTDLDSGIYVSTDDFGLSYYFRGNVENNYVKFGKTNTGYDMIWRIIRINGDGSIRMIYFGNSNSSDKFVGYSAYKTSPFNNNTYIGYMSGNENGADFPSVHSNLSSSSVKTFLDNWYLNNIVNTDYDSYVADAIYCNDRSIYSGTGVGTSDTVYASYNRLVTNHIPTFHCVNDDDRFTTSSVLGNGKLTYPIGLITADEVVFAGGKYDTANLEFYLFSSGITYTMTPLEFSSSTPYMFSIPARGGLGKISVSENVSIRPVISLRADAIKSGNGSSGSPFSIVG